MKYLKNQIVCLLAILCLVVTVSAFDFDNVKNYNPQEKVITLKNSIVGIPTSTLAEYKLTYNSDYCSVTCSAEGNVKLYSSDQLFRGIKTYYAFTDNEKSISSLKLFIGYNRTETYEEQSYSKSCSVGGNVTNASANNCVMVAGKKTTKEREVVDWSEYNQSTLAPGFYHWKIEGKKNPYDAIDWIGDAFGVKLKDWAVWSPSNDVGLVGYWSLNESSGTNALEQVFSKSNGTHITGPAVGQTGKLSLAVNYSSGASQYTNITTPSIFNFTNSKNFSINLWFNTTVAAQDGQILSRDHDSKGRCFDLRYASDVAGSYDFSVFSGGNQYEIKNTTFGFNVSRWYMLTAIYNTGGGGSNLTLYLNGTFAGSFSGVSEGMDQCTGEVRIGAREYTGNNAFSSGLVDEIALYNRTLSGQEIIDLYNNSAGMPRQPQSPTMTITNLQPINTFNTTSTTNNFSANFTISLGAINNVTLKIYNASNSLVVSTANTTVTNTTFMIYNMSATLGQGVFNWSYIATSAANTIFVGSNSTITIDTTSPVVVINYPVNGTEIWTTNNQVNITFNATISDNLVLSNCWYFNTTANVSLATCGTNATISLGGGTFTLLRYANDTAGNYVYNSTTFTINNLSASTSTLPNDTEGGIVTAILNVSTNGPFSNLTNIQFIWNNTNKSYTTLSNTSNTIYATVTFNISYVNNISYTIPYFWNYTVGGSVQTTPSKSHEVYQIRLVRNETAGEVTAINYTIYDVDTGLRLNASFSSSFNIQKNNINRSLNSTDTTQANHTFKFSLYPPWVSVSMNSTTSVFSNWGPISYSPNYHYFRDANISNSTQEVRIFLLNSSKATITTMAVTDQYTNPLEGAIIQIQRFDVGSNTYALFGMGNTNFEGEDIAYLNWFDTFYKFVIIINGEVRLTTNPTKISATPLNFQISDNSTFTYDEFTGVTYNLSYVNSSRNFVLTYVDTHGEISSGCLLITKRTFTNETTVNNTCSSSVSGTIFYTVPANDTGTYYATFYATGSPPYVFATISQAFIDISKSIRAALTNEDATIYAIIALGIIISLGIFSPVLGVLAGFLGILVCKGFGFLNVTSGSIIGLGVVVVIIIAIIKD